MINILTKSAKDTQGMLLSAGGGTFNEVISSARYGFKLSDQTFARVYVKYDQFGQTPLVSGGDTPDNWNRLQAGFRLDSEPDESATFTLQGDVHRADQRFGDTFPSFTAPGGVSMEDYWSPDLLANLLGRWTRHFSADSTLTAQAYFDYCENWTRILRQRLYTLDVDLHHNFGWGERQQITWGAGYRATLDTISPTRVMRVPGREQANDQLLGLFVQDEVALVPEKLFLTLGSKVEHNDYTGWSCHPARACAGSPPSDRRCWELCRARWSLPPSHAGMEYDVTRGATGRAGSNPGPVRSRGGVACV